MIRLPTGTVCSAEEYAKKAGLSKQAIYHAIHSGRLKAYKISRVWLIPADALIVNRNIKSGKYIGINAIIDGDYEKFLKKRGINA